MIFLFLQVILCLKEFVNVMMFVAVGMDDRNNIIISRNMHSYVETAICRMVSDSLINPISV